MKKYYIDIGNSLIKIIQEGEHFNPDNVQVFAANPDQFKAWYFQHQNDQLIICISHHKQTLFSSIWESNPRVKVITHDDLRDYVCVSDQIDFDEVGIDLLLMVMAGDHQPNQLIICHGTYLVGLVVINHQLTKVSIGPGKKQIKLIMKSLYPFKNEFLNLTDTRGVNTKSAMNLDYLCHIKGLIVELLASSQNEYEEIVYSGNGFEYNELAQHLNIEPHQFQPYLTLVGMFHKF